MENLLNTIVENQNTDVDFDKSKVKQYTVTHKSNGNYAITIHGPALEKMFCTLDNNYKIKELTKTSNLILYIFWTTYFIFVYLISYGILYLLCWIFKLIKKIVCFFKTTVT